MDIRLATRSEAATCTDIYNHWVRTSVGTFDTGERDLPATEAWFDGHQDPAYPLLVARTDAGIVGWRTLTAWSARTAYARTAEISVFVHPEHLGRRVGQTLTGALIRHARQADLRVLIARVENSNDASKRLFERAGFEPVGVMHAVGYKFGRWLDVLVLQKDLLLPHA